MDFITHLKESFHKNSNAEYAQQMKAYLKNKFELYGVKSKPRRDILKASVKEHSPEVKANIISITFELYAEPQRELHHCGMELFEKHFKNNYQKEDINYIEKLIITNSWWDTVDYIAKWILGNYLKQFPDQIPEVIYSFSKHENMWLNRSVLLFQLGYKEKTDAALLFQLCLEHKESKEFFIQKAIGWTLREYEKSNPEAVLKFVQNHILAPLSHREAIRNII
ncbi:DNA alkylation repair protein [Lacinutrix sp. WUR7]|uniref:DNA alkylation repair protein n=1 Tax=Lacinutrix sp. WUR7 TaxID=2653681 RepID=UPI00193CDE56|nr:DNA alkylation repair protein [Lacinutrix sp. WUR7]QRM90667.1 DNA alkylation repair protein [Lacinutrix sp. WUR7]